MIMFSRVRSLSVEKKHQWMESRILMVKHFFLESPELALSFWVAQISKQTSPFVKETSPKLPFSTFYRIYYRVFASWKERKGKFSLKLATDLWSSRPSSTSKSTLIFPSSKQNRHLDDRRNSCLTGLGELLLWGPSPGLRSCDDICEIHSFHNDVIIFENTTTTGQRNVFRKVNFSSPL